MGKIKKKGKNCTEILRKWILSVIVAVATVITGVFAVLPERVSADETGGENVTDFAEPSDTEEPQEVPDGVVLQIEEIETDESNIVRDANLAKSPKDVYDALHEIEKRVKAAMLAGASSVDISDLNIDANTYRIGYLYSYSPYFLPGIRSYSSNGKAVKVTIDTGSYSPQAISQYFKEVDAKLAEIKSLVSSDMTDEQKALVIHDYFVSNSEYINDGTLKCHMSSAIIMRGQGVCQSYATAYMYVMNMLGVECGLVDSSLANHCWNIIKINGKYYHADLTFDDPIVNGSDQLGMAVHNYFLLTSSELNKNGDVYHSNWTADGSITTSSDYSSAFWRKSESPVVFDGDYAYYCGSQRQYYITKRNLKTNAETNISPQPSYHPGLFKYGDKVYYNAGNDIYYYTPKDGTSKKIFQAGDQIYGCRPDVNRILYKTGGVIKAVNFDGTTNAKSGWCIENGKYVCYDANGIRVSNQWVGDYYARNDGTRAISEWTSDGYYVGSDGRKVKGWQTIGGKYYYFGDDNKLRKNQWIGDYYVKNDGTKAISEWVSGDYYVGSDGRKVKGWQTIDGKSYYFGDDYKLRKNQWVGDYFVDSSGAMVKSKWLYEDLKYYYVGSDGKMYKNGWYKIDGKENYFYSDGHLEARYTEEHFGVNGDLKWIVVRVNNTSYYLDKYFIRLNGWKEIDGFKYYFYGPGLMAYQWKNIDGDDYYFSPWMNKNMWINGKYLTESGKMAKNQILTVNGVKYSFDKDGNAKKLESENNNQKNGWNKISGKWHFFKNGREVFSEWINDGGTWYYLDWTGTMKTGWLKDGTTWYYLDGTGAMKTGWLKDGTTWYYLDGSGAMKTGWLKDGATWYYLDGAGAMKTGWLKDGATWYYFEGSGAMATGWRNVDGTWYYFEGSGAMATGWKEVDGAWYYFYPSGAMASNVWEGNYYLNGNGSMAVSQWIGRYHVGADGAWDMTA